jgi:transposase
MDERLQFVARRLAGEPMAELCREFGISRKTGYKIFDRYQECGVQGLTDRRMKSAEYYLASAMRSCPSRPPLQNKRSCIG